MERRVVVHIIAKDSHNKAQLYPAEKYYNMLKGLAYESMESLSKTGLRILKNHFDNLPPDEAKRLLKNAELFKVKKED